MAIEVQVHKWVASQGTMLNCKEPDGMDTTHRYPEGFEKQGLGWEFSYLSNWHLPSFELFHLHIHEVSFDRFNWLYTFPSDFNPCVSIFTIVFEPRILCICCLTVLCAYVDAHVMLQWRLLCWDTKKQWLPTIQRTWMLIRHTLFIWNTTTFLVPLWIHGCATIFLFRDTQKVSETS